MKRTKVPKGKKHGDLSGLQNVMKNLHKAIEGIEVHSMKALIRSVIIIRRDMDKVSPLIPVDLGNLRYSFFTVTGTSWWTDTGEVQPNKSPVFKGEEGSQLSAEHEALIQQLKTDVRNKLIVYFGFSANYATLVHELIDGTFQKPGSGAKFLELAIDRNRAKILQEIIKHAKIK